MVEHSRKILAKIITDSLGTSWECQICRDEMPRRTHDVTPMMIHLVQVHHIKLEFQSFPPGILQEGAIFHVAAKAEKLAQVYDNLFQPSPYSED